MPKGRQLSREELEIENALSSEGSSRLSSGGAGNVIRVNTSTPTIAQVHHPVEHTAHVEQPVQQARSGIQRPRLALNDLAALIRDSVVSGIKEAFPVTNGTSKRKRPLAVETNDIDNFDNFDEIDDDMPEVGVDAAVLGDTESRFEIFGADVNESDYEDLSEGEDDPDHSFVPIKESLVRNPPKQ